MAESVAVSSDGSSIAEASAPEKVYETRKPTHSVVQQQPSALALSSSVTEQLVPIRVDLDVDGLRYIDSFTWNLHETYTSPEAFAARTVADLELPPRMQRPLARCIREHLEAWHTALPVWAGGGCISLVDETLVPIRLNIRLRALLYRDQFEWDINEPLNKPEVFAAQLVADLQLPQEMEPAIALAITEQITNYRQLRSGPAGA
eukprot:5757-Heterococcus_DN1.PRE.1